MPMLYDLSLWIYNLTLIPIIFISVLFLLLVLLNLSLAKTPSRYKKLKTLPFISVQIPTYNDPIAVRCVEHCLAFDYPKEKYEIIIADDSTNQETQEKLKQLAGKHPGFVKYVHRNHREGFKAGALQDAMQITKGEILVLFDADWKPKKDFLKRVIEPFSDPKVALVQTRQGFYNKDYNLITRFASYLLMVYHTIIMPINNKINCVFFCGTGGALRRSAFEKVGGWNTKSVTEDADLSFHLLTNGYTTVYLDYENQSEVPETFESFLKQQMRWCYGNVRVFMDNAGAILVGKGLTIKQRLMIVYITMGNIIAPVIIAMTFFGFGGWFLGEPQLFNAMDFVDLLSRFMYTAGFFLMGIVTLYKRGMLGEIKYLIATTFTLGIVLAMSNTIAFCKAILNHPLHWFCTPKGANDSYVK